MAAVIDYIVYMTYDLHGQWDYGNPNAFDSCASGKCIRSHGKTDLRSLDACELTGAHQSTWPKHAMLWPWVRPPSVLLVPDMYVTWLTQL